jgi:hypothetical protein
MALSVEVQEYVAYINSLGKGQLQPSLYAALFEELYELINSAECDSVGLAEFDDVPVGAVPEALMTRARSAIRATLQVSAVVSSSIQHCRVHSLL